MRVLEGDQGRRARGPSPARKRAPFSARPQFKRIKKRRGAKIGRVAVMRRLTTILWHMLKRKQKYRYDSPIKKHKEFDAYEGSTT